jgi:sulfonate transport system substrate-binding protein
MKAMRALLLAALLALLAACGSGGDGGKPEPPKVIRIGAPAIAGDTQGIWGVMGIARSKGWVQEEFAKDHITVEFPGFKGGGPMVGQALANGQIDFAGNGDMISLIGKSSGIKSRLILPSGRLENAYLLVKPDSPIQSIADLRGKKVAYFKGNYIQLQVIRILAAAGLKEADIHNISLLGPPAGNALLNGSVDAVFSGSESLALVDKGLARIAYSTVDGSARLTAQAGLLVREEFARDHPDLVQRLVNVLVRTAQWASDEKNRDEVLAILARGGRSETSLRRDYGGRPLGDRFSPLLDPFFVAQYQDTQHLVQQLGLLRGPPTDINQWFDRQYLDAALKAQGLQDAFVPLDAQGNRPH